MGRGILLWVLTKLLVESVFSVPLFSNSGYTHRGEASCRVTHTGTLTAFCLSRRLISSALASRGCSQLGFPET